jgi:hypothetical protein
LLPSAKSKRIRSFGDTTDSIFTGAAFTNVVAAPNTVGTVTAIQNASRTLFVLIFALLSIAAQKAVPRRLT